MNIMLLLHFGSCRLQSMKQVQGPVFKALENENALLFPIHVTVVFTMYNATSFPASFLFPFLVGRESPSLE